MTILTIHRWWILVFLEAPSCGGESRGCRNSRNPFQDGPLSHCEHGRWSGESGFDSPQHPFGRRKGNDCWTTKLDRPCRCTKMTASWPSFVSWSRNIPQTWQTIDVYHPLLLPLCSANSPSNDPLRNPFCDSLCLSTQSLSFFLSQCGGEHSEREKKRTKNLLTPSPFLVKPTPCQQYRATIKEKEAALPNIFQCAPQKKTEKNNEIALKLDCSSYTYCGLWSSGVSWRPSYTIVHQLICLCCHTITDVRAIKSKDTRGDCRQSKESLNRWNMKLSDVFLVVVLFTCSASGNRFETPINL